MDIFEEIKKILVEHLHAKEDQIKPDAKLVDDLGADSLDTVDIVLSLEEKFSVEISDEEAQSVNTVDDIVAVVNGKLKNKQ